MGSAHPFGAGGGRINIVETMLLSELADAGVTGFRFVLAPLKPVGATGSPVRPLAVVA